METIDQFLDREDVGLDIKIHTLINKYVYSPRFPELGEYLIKKASLGEACVHKEDLFRLAQLIRIKSSKGIPP